MINKINKLSQTEFIKVFANIFENARWIAEELYNKKPFNSFKELSAKMLDICLSITGSINLTKTIPKNNIKINTNIAFL